MKGVSEWVWVIGGVIVGLSIFSFAYTNMVETNQAALEQQSIEGFNEIKNTINNLCWSFAGNNRRYELTLSKSVEGVYLAGNQHKEYQDSDLVNKILSGQVSNGKHLCINIKGKRLRCEELDCEASMPFIGSVPEKFSLNLLIDKLLGRGLSSKYYLKFIRNPSNVTIFVLNSK